MKKLGVLLLAASCFLAGFNVEAGEPIDAVGVYSGTGINEAGTQASVPIEVQEEESTEPEAYTVNLKMVGDGLIHQPLYEYAQNPDGSYNFDFMFENVKEDIEAADIAIINQETIFTTSSAYSGYPTFGSPVEVGVSEVNAGFDIIAHATNHTMDKRNQGVIDTLNFWSSYPEIGILGIHSSEDESDIYYVIENNISFAFVNYTYGLNGMESYRNKNNPYIVDVLTDTDIESTVVEADANSDVTVAILHVGNEYVYTPTAYEQEQVDRFIDLGADIVLCSHPHVIEPYEMRTTANGNTALVYYSLGNFISWQKKVPRVLGGMADITISKTDDIVSIDSYTMIPLVTHQEGTDDTATCVTTYKLEDYTDELASRHKLGLTVQDLWDLWYSVIGAA